MYKSANQKAASLNLHRYMTGGGGDGMGLAQRRGGDVSVLRAEVGTALQVEFLEFQL